MGGLLRKTLIFKRLNKSMEKKITIILVVLLIIFGIAFAYKMRLARPSEEEVISDCHIEAIENAREEFKTRNPKEKEKIGEGTYSMDDYNKYYNWCLIKQEH